MKVALGLDIGTTAVKALALDEEGRVVARAGAAHDLMTPHPGWAEGDPDAWPANATACTAAWVRTCRWRRWPRWA